jgi:hypothetical protein
MFYQKRRIFCTKIDTSEHSPIFITPSLTPKPLPNQADGIKRGLARDKKEAVELINGILETQKAADLNNTYTFLVKQETQSPNNTPVTE